MSAHSGLRPLTFAQDSGHGGQTKDLDGDEADGYDEVIYPVDFEYAGHIVDDVSASLARLSFVFDAQPLCR